MISSHSLRLYWLVLILTLPALLPALQSAHARAGSKPRHGTVWIAFFSSRDCPVCKNVKRLTNSLKKKYPVRVKLFDIDKPADYALLARLEGIHTAKGFSIPLLMLGETILMGEDRISNRLEKTVRALARSGGSTLPYLGPDKKAKSEPPAPVASARRAGTRTSASSRCPCADSGRPPTISDEWNKISSFLDRLF
jgi:glutaredoxin